MILAIGRLLLVCLVWIYPAPINSDASKIDIGNPAGIVHFTLIVPFDMVIRNLKFLKKHCDAASYVRKVYPMLSSSVNALTSSIYSSLLYSQCLYLLY